MPMYDFECIECDIQIEDIVRSSDPECFPICTGCNARFQRAGTVPVPASYIGYSATGNDYGIRGGTVFHTAAQRRTYDEKHKIDGIHDKHSGKGKMIVEEARSEADSAAQVQGYKDHTDYRKKKKYEKRLGKGQLASFEKRVQV